MIYRLRYCNKDGVEARVDIIKGSSTPVEVIEGTGTPFVLNYKMDKPDKSGFFMTSSADISIFETTSFNIDSLKTSSETEIKVEHYIDNILDWSGFVIPDFFSKTIGSPSTVEMVASDRLATLKGVTLTDLNQYTSMRDLAVACLAQTGLSLPLYTLADFGNDGQTNAFFKSLGLSSRLSDTKGRNISCYDILKSILVASNSKLVQQDGAWHIVNKWQHEQGVGNLFSNLTSSTSYSEQTINFSDVHVGGRRSIIPVAAITGVYHEFGGGRSYPDNFDFRDFGLIPEFNFPDWTKGGTFNVSRGNKEIIGYSFDGQMQFGANTVDNYFFNSNVFNTSNYLQMDGIPVPYATGQIEVVLDLNATAQTVSQFLTNVTAVKIAVGAVKDGSPTIWLNNSGIFAEDNVVIHNLNFERGATYQAQTKGFNLKGVINNPEGYSIIMRIYGSRDEGEDNRRQVAIHFARIEFKNTQDAPKGTIYKRRQGTDFTKEHDIDTTIFGDYMQKGLDGYFYEYPFDDTSSLYRTAGTLTQPLWTAPNDTEQLPLLQHVTRQKSRMFSLAHNMISARINVSSFKPLNIFIDCNSERHVVVSATYDFLRSEVEVELEQIASTTLNVRDFIYSYFGDGESGIKSVGGISGGTGGGGTGGGLTPEQLEILSWWKKDPDNPNTIFTEMNAYSKLELSAYGAGDGGGGGGGDGSVTSVGISVPTGLSVANSPITSSGVIAIGLQAGYSIPTTAKQGQWDTAYGWGNHSDQNYFKSTYLTGFSISSYDANNGDDSGGFVGSYTYPDWLTNGAFTGYGGLITWKGRPATGLKLQMQYDVGHLNPTGGRLAFRTSNSNTDNDSYTNWKILWHSGDFTSTEVNNWNTAFTNSHAHSNKTQLDLITQSNIDVLARLSIVNGNLQINGNAYATGELSAYGVGTGGGGGGGLIDTVYGYGDLGQTFNNATLTNTFNAYTINQINTRLVAVESDFGNWEIGVRNLVLNSENGRSLSSTVPSSSPIEDQAVSGENYRRFRRTYPEGITSTTIATVTGEYFTPEKSGYYTYSTYFRPNEFDIELRMRLTGATYGNFTLCKANEWTQVSVTAYIEAGVSTRLYGVHGAMPPELVQWIDYNRVSVTSGTIPIDWTPAPEDQVSDWLTTDINSFSFIKNKPTTLSGYGITDAVTLNTAQTISGAKTFTASVTAPTFIGALSGNASSATKLQTARTIWGQSFDGTGNVTGALSGATTGSFTGDVAVNTLNISSTALEAHIAFSRTSINYITTPLSGGINFITNGDSLGSPNSMMILSSNGNVGIGKGFTNSTTSITAQLHVIGNILATGTTTTTKVIFNSAGWSMEQVGSELQMRHNNILKMRFTSTGSIVATEEITAFG